MPLSKSEANLMLCLRVRCVSFSLFPLASSCLNDYFHAYAIIDYLTVFLNMVTFNVNVLL